LSLNFALELKNIFKIPSGQAELEKMEKEEEQGS
jgi:hypothetical protein